MNDLLQKLDYFLQTTQVCCLSSIDNEGYPETRAMLMPIKVEDNTLYLHTNASSNKAKDFKHHEKASLYFFNPATFQGLIVFGKMEVLESIDDKKRFWKDGHQIYYTKGEHMEDFCILKLTITKGKFYSNFAVVDYKA